MLLGRLRVTEFLVMDGTPSTIRYSQDRLVAPVREAVDPAVVAASRMAGVAMTAIVVGEIGTNPWVVVFGLGLVGNLASQMFQIHGCRVIGVDPVAARRKLAQRCGTCAHRWWRR